MSDPAVSVLIPTYNYARFLPEAIESVLSQDFTDFELIIADDASADDTVRVCRQYADCDRRIRFVQHEKNLGMVANWNWCLQQARGKYIKFLLADDKLNGPDALRTLIALMESGSGVSLAVSARQLIDENSVCGQIAGPLGSRDRIFRGRDIIRRCLKTDINLVGEPTAALFRRSDASRGFDPTYRQLVDMEMWFHLLQRGRLAYGARPLCCFRQHPAQQTEVNKQAGVHHLESGRLLLSCYSRKEAGQRMLFRRISRLKRGGLPGCNVIVEELEKEFSTAEYVMHHIWHKLIRRMEKIGRSVMKRVPGRAAAGKNI